jgi:hypothetical protein
MVGYVHNSTTLLRIWIGAIQIVKSQSNVIFDEERNTHASGLPGAHIDNFELPEETENIQAIDSGGGDLQAPDNETDGDGLLQDHTANSRTGDGHGSGDYDWTDNDTDYNLPDADNRQSLPASRGVRSRRPDEEDATPVSRESVVHNRHLHCETDEARRTVTMTKHSCQPPHANRLTRNQVEIPANLLIIIANDLASTCINSNPFTYMEAMNSPQHEH